MEEEQKENKDLYDMSIIKKWAEMQGTLPDIAKLNEKIEKDTIETLKSLAKLGTITWIIPIKKAMD